MKFTPNGRADLRTADHTLFHTGDIFDAIDKNDKNFIKQKTNADLTFKTRSMETIKRQEKHFENKREAVNRIVEIEAMIKPQLTNADGLFNRLVASFNAVGVEQTIKNFENDLITFKQYSDEHMSLQGFNGDKKKVIPFYDELLIGLAKAFPPFISYLPSRCFLVLTTNGNLINISNLPLEEIKKLQTQLEKDGTFNNPKFRKRYLKYFPDHIEELKNIDEIAHALAIDPKSFNNFAPDGAFRSGFYQNINPLITILTRVPQVLSYVTEEEIDLLAKEKISTIGNAIFRCPEVLENIPANFFIANHPKHVFTQKVKNEVKNRVLPFLQANPTLLARFDVLVEYFNSKAIAPNPKRANSRKKEEPVKVNKDDELYF